MQYSRSCSRLMLSKSNKRKRKLVKLGSIWGILFIYLPWNINCPRLSPNYVNQEYHRIAALKLESFFYQFPCAPSLFRRAAPPGDISLVSKRRSGDPVCWLFDSVRWDYMTQITVFSHFLVVFVSWLTNVYKIVRGREYRRDRSTRGCIIINKVYLKGYLVAL